MVTIRDVAKLAGVSMTTVSRAFNEKAVIKDETRQAILKIAKEIGYVPNYNARGLVTNRKFVIGIFFSSLRDGTSQSFLSTIISAAYEMLPNNYLLSVNDILRVTDAEALVRNRMDGVMIVSQSENDNDFIYKLKGMGLPMVVINRQLSDTEIRNISGNGVLGVKQAIDYAAKLGHKRVGMIEGMPGFVSAVNRRHGFDLGVLENGLTAVKEAIQVGDYSSASGQAAMTKILALPVAERPTLVFCANDDMAIGALHACYAAGVHVPDDISVIGFDDSYYASMSVPALTTVKKPVVPMTKRGLADLLRLIDGEKLDGANRLKIPAALIIRDSVRKLN